MNIAISKRAAKSLHGVPQAERNKLREKLNAIAADDGDLTRHPYATKLVGSEFYRVRQGDWRAIYELDYDGNQLNVLKVGHRREVYG